HIPGSECLQYRSGHPGFNTAGRPDIRLAGQASDATDQLDPGHLPGTHAAQVLRGHLAIYQLATKAPQHSAHRQQGSFGGVAAPAEHGFSEEHSAPRDAIESADQLIALPDLDGMCVAELVEGDIGT